MLPQGLVDDYCHVLDRLVHLELKFSEYRELFGTEEAVNLLNDFAPAFFASVQDIHFDDLVLGICRLTDVPTKHDRRAWTLRGLLSSVERAVPNTAQELNARLDSLCADSKPLRDYRNDLIAHNNREVRNDHVFLETARKSLEDMIAVLAVIDAKFGLRERIWDLDGRAEHQSGGSSFLLQKLRKLGETS